MSRTNRDKNKKIRRKRWYQKLPIGAYPDQFEVFIPNRPRGGNMLMAPRESHIWWDERPPSGKRASTKRKKDAERRNRKRSERQNFRQNIDY